MNKLDRCAHQPQPGLTWTRDIFNYQPQWLKDPDAAVVKAVALPHVPGNPSQTDYDISFFAGGGFHKLYLLSPTDNGSRFPSIIMRVALPVDPYFKTACEVATLQWLLRHTGVPVPRVIAYDTSSNNLLGFEWILMDRLPGVSLHTLWDSPTLLWEERKNIAHAVMQYKHQIEGASFDRMGGLYLSPGPRAADLPWLADSVFPRFYPCPDDPDFVIGPIVGMHLFQGPIRLPLATDRGPFEGAAAAYSAMIRLEIACAAAQKEVLLGSDDCDPDDVDDLDEIIAASQELLAALPEYFEKRGEKDARFVLNHDDLSTSNILVDPDTHQVTGLVDWECVMLQPAWLTARPPYLLAGPEIDPAFYAPNFGPVPSKPTPPGGTDNPTLADLRSNLEKLLLRHHVGLHTLHPHPLRAFHNRVMGLESRPGGVIRWLQQLRETGDPFSHVPPGRNLYAWPEH